MPDPLLTAGHADRFKAGVHLGLFGLAIACLGYNAMAYGQRRERHLLTNTVLYGVLALYEVHQMNEHWKDGHR